MATPRLRDPKRFLPLKPSILAILIALDEEPRHGYAIMQAVTEQSGGTVTLDTGPLYRFLKRLLDDGLVEEMAGGESADDVRRRYYTPTSLGRQVLDAEAARLQSLLQRGRRRATAGRSTR